MPGGDGMGPAGTGRRSGMAGRVNPAGAGPIGLCRCPQCDTAVEHQRGIPCSSIKCPKCGAVMVRA